MAEARSTFAPGGPAEVKSCWLCGIRLAAHHMVADGGSACADVRWYCLDTRGCTERWTSHQASTIDARQGTARLPQRRGAQPAGPDVARPASV